MGMTSIIGGNLKMGIEMFLDARRVSSGAKEAEQAVQRVKISALDSNKEMAKSARSLASNLQGIGAGLAMVGYAAQAAGKAIIGGFIQPAYREAVKYDTALASMRSVLRYTKEEMVGVQKIIEDNAMGSMFDFTEVSLAATRLAAFTGEANKLGEQLPTLLKFMTTVGQDLDPEEASRTMSGFYVKWRNTGITYEQMGNQLIKLANVTALEFRDLPQILRSSRDIAASVNIKFEEFGALVGVLREGLSPAEAARSAAGFARALNTATGAMKEYADKKGVSFDKAMELGKTDKKAKQLVKAVSTLGVQFFDSGGKAKQFTTIIEETLAAASALKKKGDMREYQRVMLRVFKDQAKNVMSTLDAYERGGKSSAEGFKALAKELANSEGYLTWAAGVMGDAATNIEKKWEASVNRFRASFGKPLMLMFLPILVKLSDFMDGLTRFSSENPRVAKAIGILTVAFAGLLVVAGTLTAVLGGVALWLSFILPVITGTSVGAAGATFKFGSLATKLGAVAKYLGPTGILIGGLIAFREAVNKNTNFDAIIDKFKVMGLVIQGVMEWMSGKETKGSRSLYRKLKAGGLLGTVELLLQVVKRISTFMSGFFERVSWGFAMIGAAVDAVIAPVARLLDLIGWLFTSFAGGRKDLMEQLGFWQTLGRVVGLFVSVHLFALVSRWIAARVAVLAFGKAMTLAAGVWGVIILSALMLAGLLGQESTWSAMFDVFADIRVWWENFLIGLEYYMTKLALKINFLQPTSVGGSTLEEYKKGMTELGEGPKYIDQELGRKLYKDSGFQSEATAAMKRDEYEAAVYEKEHGFRAPGLYGNSALPVKREPTAFAYGEGQASNTPNAKMPQGPVRDDYLVKQGFKQPKVILNIDARGSIGLNGKSIKEAITTLVKDGMTQSAQVSHAE